MTTRNTPSSPSELIASLLDRGYAQATRQVVQSIANMSPVVTQRLADLEIEAQRLSEAGERLRPDNPVLRALMADLEPQLRRNAAMIEAVAPDLQSSASEAAGTIQRQLALPGFSDEALRVIGIAWNVPDPEAVAALVDYVNRAEFRSLINDFLPNVQQVVINQAIRGIAEGWSPLKTAREIVRMTQSVPLAQAQTMMRTLQLTSYRDATVAHQVANADIVDEVIRIAALDRRTCLACVALHGTKLQVGERVNDHHNGRCTSVVKVRGRELTVQTGEDWFNSLPIERQREQSGFATTPAKFRAFQDGAVRLNDFVQPYKDDVFGDMVREASLKGVLGDGAQRYYLS